jgi:hypothetical protein
MILETIAIVQTANAAIGAVKELIGNGQDLMSCGKQLGEYFNAKAEIQSKANRGGSGNELEMFFELESLKQQEEELKTMMIYQGRAGMWDDWLQFQANQKRLREEEKKRIALEKIKKQEKLKNIALIGGLSLLVIVLVAGGIYGMISLANMNG